MSQPFKIGKLLNLPICVESKILMMKEILDSTADSTDIYTGHPGYHRVRSRETQGEYKHIEIHIRL